MARRAALLTAAALVLAGLGAAGWAAWNSTSAAHRDRLATSAITIEVVAPTEPDLPSPGSVLAVGELQGGYEHDADRLIGSADEAESYVESAWLELSPEFETPDEAPSPPVVASLPPAAPPQAPSSLDREDYSFGFDAPQPDYEAERRARQDDNDFY